MPNVVNADVDADSTANLHPQPIPKPNLPNLLIGDRSV